MPTLVGFQLTAGQGEVTPPIQATAALAHGGAYSLSAYAGARFSYSLIEQYRFYGNGHPSREVYGFAGELSGYSFEARCGGKAAMALSGYTLAMTTTAYVSGNANLMLSGYTLIAAGTTDEIGRAQLTYYGARAVCILGGGSAAGALSGYSGASAGKTDRLGSFAGVAPHYLFSATGTSDNHGSVIGVLPTLHVGGVGVVTGILPRATVVITGGSVSVEYEAYCFALIDNERTGMAAYATHYTTFPFDRIVRFANKHYGVAADGLYELGGDDFDGVPIVSVVQTHPDDFKARTLKRPISLYLGGRVGADFRVSIIDAETDVNAYNYRPVDKTGARNYRVFFGKGIRARYLAYALTNTNGGDFELDDITPEFVTLRRTA
jgi:hypothetical protein